MAEKRLTKKEAQELYDDLQKAVGTMMAKGQSTYSKRQSLPTGGSATTARSTATSPSTPQRPTSPSTVSSVTSARKGRNRISGEGIAFAFLGIFCCGKIALSALEVSGIASVEPAQAAIVLPPKGPQWSKEEVKVLTALDNRRVELEERAARIEQRETEATARDRDLAVRITELKELSEKLKIEREKGDKQRNAQLDQLANVYGSMNPPEAAHLLEQLDIHVALSLVERLPEKRMGQILALMNAQRALELTNLLSKRPL